MSIHKSFQKNFVIDETHLTVLMENLITVLKPIPHKWATWHHDKYRLVNSKGLLTDDEFLKSVSVIKINGVQQVRLAAFGENISSADYQTKDPIISIDMDTTTYDRIAIEINIEEYPTFERDVYDALLTWIDGVTSHLLTQYGLIDVTGWWRAHTLYLLVCFLVCLGIQVVLRRLDPTVNGELHLIIAILLSLTLLVYLNAIHPAGQASFLWRSFFFWGDGVNDLNKARSRQKWAIRGFVLLITIFVTLANLTWLTTAWNFLRGL